MAVLTLASLLVIDCPKMQKQATTSSLAKSQRRAFFPRDPDHLDLDIGR
jgi:hypothetical protein